MVVVSTGCRGVSYPDPPESACISAGDCQSTMGCVDQGAMRMAGRKIKWLILRETSTLKKALHIAVISVIASMAGVPC